MRYNIDHIIEPDVLPRRIQRDDLIRVRMVALNLAGEWIPFPALEPAYACGRAAGMSPRVDHWMLFDAILEHRWVERLNREVVTLYVKAGAPTTAGGSAEDAVLLRRFARRTDPRSNYWPS